MVLDTNVVVRHLVGVPEAMAARATRLFREATRLELSDVVAAESVFVLDSFYELERPAVAEAIRALLALPAVQAENPARLQSALSIYERVRVSFVDAYSAAAALATAVPVASFDRGLDRVPGLERVEP